MALEKEPALLQPNHRRSTRSGSAALAFALVMSTVACSSADKNISEPTSTTRVLGRDFIGEGCPVFTVQAQNWREPIGASVRAKPDVSAQKIDGPLGNEIIAVDAWVRTNKPAYDPNTPPWNSDIWFHTANLAYNPVSGIYQTGWVSFAAVRAGATDSNSPNGGQPAPTTPNCEVTYTLPLP